MRIKCKLLLNIIVKGLLTTYAKALKWECAYYLFKHYLPNSMIKQIFRIFIGIRLFPYCIIYHAFHILTGILYLQCSSSSVKMDFVKVVIGDISDPEAIRIKSEDTEEHIGWCLIWIPIL